MKKVDSNKSDYKGSLELVHSGNDFFNRMEKIIHEAVYEIHLQTYIFEHDSTGIFIANSLMKAAKRGVKVYVLLDGYGTSLPSHFIKEFKDSGIYFRYFAPAFSSSSIYMGRRLHHKILVADKKSALIGGINIADKYRGTAQQKAWLDYAVQFEGSIAAKLQDLCKNIYIQKNQIRRNRVEFHHIQDAAIRYIQNDWLRKQNDISSMYLNRLRQAKNEIIIVGSYFLPGRRLSNAILKKSKKGVRIKLILAGLSDVPLIKRASSFLYAKFLRNDVELYEWNESVLHGKVATVDRKWSTVGSFNLNHLSSYASIEMNVEIESKWFADKLTDHLNEISMKCERITLDDLNLKLSKISKLMNWISYKIVRIATIFLIYIPYKHFFVKARNGNYKYIYSD